MDRRTILAIAATLGLNVLVHAQNLQGTISNRAGKPVANAIVTLTPKGLSDTTGADGVYAITVATSIAPTFEAGNGDISFQNGVLQVVLGDAAPVNVEIFDLRGTRLRSEGLRNAPAGVYRWDIGNTSGTKVLAVKVSIGQKVETFLSAQLRGAGNGAQYGNIGPVGGALARVAALPDSLKVTASGYITKSVAVPSLDSTVNIVLDTFATNSTAPSSGCSKTPSLTSGKQTIQSGGQARTYIIRIPPNYDNTHPYPLVFAYHWVGGTEEDVDGGGSSGYVWSYYGLRKEADTSANSKMIFVAPQGIGNGWGNGNNSDVIFTDDMTSLIEGQLCVDKNRLFAMGFSYGGGMTKALGCQRPDVFRAVAVYSGADFLSGGCDATTTKPIAYIGMHSVSDPTNPYSSGETIRDRFAKNDGCVAQEPPKPVGLTHVCTMFQGCSAGHPVEWCAFDGGGHTPAPVDGSTNGSGGGDVTWTKAEVWKFFTQF